MTTHPNPVRSLESHGIQDQTDDAFSVVYENCDHHMISIKVNSESIPYVERCSHCGWIDGASLEWWGHNIIKTSLSERAGRIALAAETEPFAFVQGSDGEDLTLEEILGQALGAASMCWDPKPHTQVFDSTRAVRIAQALIAEVHRHINLNRKPVLDLAYELYALACNSDPKIGFTSKQAERWQGAFTRLRAQFHAELAEEVNAKMKKESNDAGDVQQQPDNEDRGVRGPDA